MDKFINKKYIYEKTEIWTIKSFTKDKVYVIEKQCFNKVGGISCFGTSTAENLINLLIEGRLTHIESDPKRADDKTEKKQETFNAKFINLEDVDFGNLFAHLKEKQKNEGDAALEAEAAKMFDQIKDLTGTILKVASDLSKVNLNNKEE